MMYTVEVFRKDGRTKLGERLVKKVDVEAPNECEARFEVSLNYRGKGYSYKVFETYVTRKNLMTGVECQERYDRPYCCSPSSQTYWSM